MVTGAIPDAHASTGASVVMAGQLGAIAARHEVTLVTFPPEDRGQVAALDTWRSRGISVHTMTTRIPAPVIRAKRRIERHRAESQLDATKTLASLDFAEVPMLSKDHVMALASGDAWLDKGATVLIFGPPGVGKSHVGCGIGHALIDAGYRVLYMRTSELVQRLQAPAKACSSATTCSSWTTSRTTEDPARQRQGSAQTSIIQRQRQPAQGADNLTH